MTGKEAYELIEAILSNHSFMLEVKDKRNECLAIIKQDLERLEVLEKENKKWREIIGCDLCEALGREILLEENEKLKKQIEDLENNKRGSKQ